MRIGIISDIHGNFEALKAACAAIRKAGCKRIVCLGDIVGYGAKPCECLDFIRDNGIESIRGNHDHYVTEVARTSWHIQEYAQQAILWTRRELGEERVKWLDALPFTMEMEHVIFVHASLEALDGEYWPYILGAKAAMFHFFIQKHQVAFFGHTHVPLYFSYDTCGQVVLEMLKSKTLDYTKDCKYLINPGSVGQPRDFDHRASSVIFDLETGEVILMKTVYDVEKTQKEILDAGLPAMLATRLSRGN